MTPTVLARESSRVSISVLIALLLLRLLEKQLNALTFVRSFCCRIIKKMRKGASEVE
jgi:hypothetical protein